MSWVDRLDRYQRTHAWLGVPIAVIYKFFDGRGLYLSAVITYYAFLSLFPLLLLSFSILGFVLQGHPELRMDLENAALQKLPGIGAHLGIRTFQGSGLALVVGVIGLLYAGLGATQAAQASFNQIYGVPRNEQPNPVKSRIRSLGLLALLGTGVLLSTGLAALLTTANGVSRQLGTLILIAGYVLNYLLNFALFSFAFRLLTTRDLKVRQVMRGGLVAAALYLLVQIFGTTYVTHVAKASVYQAFAVVIGTLLWMYLQSLILVLAAEINVVTDLRLWPRALLTPFTDDVELTTADRRVYAMYATTQRFKGFEHVTVAFADPPSGHSAAEADAPAKQE
jgi:membrane protein